MPTPAELLPSSASEEETKKAISDTIRMLTKEKVGKTPAQRVAIAYSQAEGSTGKAMSPQKGAGKALKKKEGKNMNQNIRNGVNKLPARGAALPVEQLSPESSDDEVGKAIAASVILLLRQGVPEEDAKATAYRLAESATGRSFQLSNLLPSSLIQHELAIPAALATAPIAPLIEPAMGIAQIGATSAQAMNAAANAIGTLVQTGVLAGQALGSLAGGTWLASPTRGPQK